MTDQWNEQIERARVLGVQAGTEGLWRHAMVGRMCGCRDCFCCAAMRVLDELRAEVRELRQHVGDCTARRYSCEHDGRFQEAAEWSMAIREAQVKIARLEKGGGQ